MSVRERIRAAVETHGATRTASVMEMDREVVLAIAAGARVRQGSLLLAEQRIDLLAKLADSPPRADAGRPAGPRPRPTARPQRDGKGRT